LCIVNGPQLLGIYGHSRCSRSPLTDGKGDLSGLPILDRGSAVLPSGSAPSQIAHEEASSCFPGFSGRPEGRLRPPLPNHASDSWAGGFSVHDVTRLRMGGNGGPRNAKTNMQTMGRAGVARTTSVHLN
jgi:hypothetical protein